ncbi:MAG: hypothetical protein A2139_12530 [Desulfobacca sp. RBG_16_60_12]|nr:MAG: hypothetical protein A2139_12530 [Desulfobacca sp. RBG_16_60_12]
MGDQLTNEDDLAGREVEDHSTETDDELIYLEDDFIDVEAELAKVFEGDFPRVLEVRLESLETDDEDWEQDLVSEQVYDTQHGAQVGHTFNPEEATEQGLVYTPPTDPPVLPGDDPQGADMATGYAPGMEDTDPDVEDLPPNVDDNDLDLLEDIEIALRNNSETQHLTHIKVQVNDGVVTLLGSVPGDEDVDLVYAVLNDLDGIVEIRDYLSIEADEDLEAEAEGGEELVGAPRVGAQERTGGETEAEDIVDETSDGSFPASDPPAWTSTRA